MSVHHKQDEFHTKGKVLNEDEKVSLNIPSEHWIKKFGLKKQRLELKQILTKVGFRNCDDYIKILKKPVTSKYSDGLFKKVAHTDGIFYNVTASNEKLIHVEEKLKQAIDLYKSRLEWLNSGSRRVFGVFKEKHICIICDLQQESEVFFPYSEIVKSVIKDQFCLLQSLIMIRAAPEMQKWVSSTKYSDEENIKHALSWWADQLSFTEYTITCVLEAIIEASSSGDKIKSISTAVNVVLLQQIEVSKEDEKFLQTLTSQSGGSLHTFNLDADTENSSLSQRDKNIRPEVMAVWEELDNARTILYEVKKLITEIEKEKHTKMHNNSTIPDEKPPVRKDQHQNELNMTSKEWLKIHGLKKMRLTLETFLKESVFNHCNGILNNPHDETDPSVLVDARYCHKFAHLEWRDGSVKHVHVTESVYRKYREKLLSVLEKYKKRLHWLQRGSRELFGTVVENKVLILIDTSASMAIKIDTVKRKLLKLCKEQLTNKEKFSIISFNSKVVAWREHLVKCNVDNLENALQWVNSLNVQGSTNTFGALGMASQIDGVEGIYLLSDGRPDQPPEMILSQVDGTIPIHTISFNCTDPEANHFLYELATKTKGRYHCFSEIITSDNSMPPVYESDDLTFIRKEMELGIKDLESMLQLRNECFSKDMIFKEQKREKSTSKTSPQQRPFSAVAYNETRSSLLRNIHTVSKKLSEKQHNTDNEDVKDEKPKKKKKRRKKMKGSDSEIKRWLQENSLSAQKLTILDALKPTMIKQKPTYVSSLGKEVLSKVYGDIFPIIHTSSGKSKEFQIVNPQAIDLISYEKKLQNALDVIEKKLDELVSDHISYETKEKLFPDNEPIRFLEMKEEIMEDLAEQELDASIAKDIKRLEKELEQGQVYMKQSKDLRATVEQLSKEARDEKKKGVEEKTGASSKSPKQQTNPKFRYHRVLARSDLDGFYHPAIVNKYINARFVNVVFDDGELQLTCVRFLIPIGGSTPCPVLNIGDYVLVKCYSQDEMDANHSFYVPGIVQVSPLKMKATDNFYTIVKYDTTKSTVQRKDLVKITRSRFVFSIKFIQEVQRNIPSFDTKQFESVQGLHVPRPPSVASTSSRSSAITPSRVSSRASSRRSSSHSFSSSRKRLSNSNNVIKTENEASSMEEDEKEANKNENKDEEERASIVKEIEKLKSEKQLLLEEIQKQLETDHASKLKEIEEQRTTLVKFNDKLALNEAKLSEQQEDMERLRAQLVKEKEDFLEKKLDQQNEEKEQLKDQYKELSVIHLQLFKRLQEQQDQFLTRMFEITPPQPPQPPTTNKKDQTTLTEGNHLYDEKPCLDDDNDEKTDEENLDNENERNNEEEEGEEKKEDIRVLVSPITDAILLAQGDSGVFVSRSPLDLDPAVSTKNLPNLLEINEEVLSRFMDDGWYYRGIVKKVMAELSKYLIEDGVGDVEEVDRNDIITDDEDAPIVIRVGDYVVALHPCYLYAYAPGCVTSEEPDMSYNIQFYDGQTSVVPRAETYFIGLPKFERDVNYIRARENALIGQAVVCRSNKSGVYHLGAIRNRMNGCRNYLVEWADQSLDIQNYAHIFGAHTKRHKFVEGSNVLAICNTEKFDYLPGTVLECNGSLLQVEFIDTRKLQNIDANQSFWLSPEYFRMAYTFWKDKHKIDFNIS